MRRRWWPRWRVSWQRWASLGAVLAAAALASAGEPPGEIQRLGVVGFYNPRLMVLKYQPLADYLSDTTPWRWELDISTDYLSVEDGLCGGRLALAYLGPFTYTRTHERCGAEPVVRLDTAGRPTYRSLILVRHDSDIRRLADLAGKVFAFGSPLSTSSHLVPRAMLLEAGLEPGRDLRCRYYGHHDRAARAVVLREAAACGVRDLVGERFVGRGLRVLAASRPLPNFPLVAGPGTGPEVRREVIRALVDLPERDPGLRARIARWDEELAAGFARCSAADYAPIRALILRVFGPRGLTAGPAELRCGPVSR